MASPTPTSMTTTTPTPAIPAPTGQVSNFNAYNELAFWNALTQGLALGITGVLFFLRLYIRIFCKRIWNWEDYFATVSFCSLAVYSTMTTLVVIEGGGNHEWNVTNVQIKSILFYVNMSQIFYGITAALVKTTILLLYIRIFSPTPWSKFNIAIKVLILVIDGYYFGNTFAKIFQCMPRDKIWEPTLAGTCINLSILLDVSGVFNCLSDIVILLVPIKGLWALKISTKQKFGIYFVFTVGIIGPAFSLVGFIQRFQRSGSPDQSYNQLVILLWATAELAAGMMIICIPTIPGLFQHRREQSAARSAGASNQVLSSRSRISKLGISAMGNYGSPTENRHVVNNNYFELVEPKADLEKRDPQVALKKLSGSGTSDNSVEVSYGGGYAGGYPGYSGGYSGYSGYDNRTSDNGILKTVTVEQSRF